MIDKPGKRRPLPSLMEEQFRVAIEAAPNAMLMIDQTGTIVLVNAPTEALFGYTRAELIGKPLELLIPARYRHQHPAYRDGFLAEPRSRPMGEGRDLFGLHKNGREVPVEIGLNPLTTEEGSFVLAAIIDITSRKRAEERFRAAVESAPNAMVMVNAQGVIVLVNSQTEKLFGYQRDELIGQPVEMLVPERFRHQHPAYRGGFFTNLQIRAMGEGRDLFGLHKDGYEVPVEIGLNPLTTEEGSFVLAAIIDITSRKRGEERFRAAVESAPNAVVIVNDTGTILVVNSQTEKLFGYQRDELIGQPVEMLVPERFRHQHPAYRTSFLAEPRSRPMGEGRDLFGLRKDHTEFPIEIGLNPLETEEGTLILSAIVDITARKRGEEQLRNAVTELARSNAELEQFAYVASHDLQEPLRAVAGCVQALQQRYQGQLDPRADELVMHAVDGAVRMQGLINDLLEYSRVATRGQPFTLADCTEIVRNALANLQVAVTESGARVTYTELPTVMGDPTQLTQLFQNLIGNACKFRDQQPAAIHITAEPHEGTWRFSVRDNGIGIEPQYFERIFGLFQRLHTRVEYSGTGIGLAICKKIVERHGGRIWLESQLQQGTTFYFTIPEQR